MALTIAPSTAPSGLATSKQIVIAAVVSSVLYTVPDGTTFTGYAVSAGNFALSINGVSIYNSASGTFGITLPLTLLGGTVVSCGSSYNAWSLMGVQS